MKKLSEKEALCKATAYCSTAEHCTSEVKKKLTDWQVDEACANRILAYLIKEKYIDEERFVRSFVRDKLLYNKWGRIKIARSLQNKQLNEACCQTCLNEIDTDEYDKILLQILNTKRKTTKGRNEYETNGKLIRFALSRGFEMELILKHIKQKEEY